MLFWTWDCLVNRVIDRAMFEEDMRNLDPATMQSQELAFCSPFLANALLALACLYTTNEETFLVPGDPLTRDAAFAKEAARLLPLDYGSQSLTVVQGLTAMLGYEGCLGSVATTLDYMKRFFASYAMLKLDHSPNPWQCEQQTPENNPRSERVAQALSNIHWGF